MSEPYEEARALGEELDKLEAKLAKAEAQVVQLKRALRRKCILDTYGITIENLQNDFDRWLEIISSNNELEQWYGEPLEDYVLADPEKVDVHN